MWPHWFPAGGTQGQFALVELAGFVSCIIPVSHTDEKTETQEARERLKAGAHPQIDLSTHLYSPTLYSGSRGRRLSVPIASSGLLNRESRCGPGSQIEGGDSLGSC